MAWARIEPTLSGHRKIDALYDQTDDDLRPLASVGLWTLSIAESVAKSSDGRVTRRLVAALAPEHGDELARMLVRATLFEKNGRGFRVHDYLDYNLSADEIEAQRQRARHAARTRWGSGKTDPWEPNA